MTEGDLRQTLRARDNTSKISAKKLTQSKHHATTHNRRTINFFSKKEGLLFSLIDHPAHPIGRGGSNQRELLASPDSPSPCASLATPLFR
jgi:hypothetical protein